MDWRSLPMEDLERHFNPRVAVADAESHLAGRAKESAGVRRRLNGRYDIAYGDGPRQVLDIFPADVQGAPIHLFIHGGYWRALAKQDFSFMAPAYVEAGVNAVVMDYDLCPTVTLDRVVAETIECVAWIAKNAGLLGGDANRIVVSGHSAGAHLAAFALAEDWTRHGLPGDLLKAAVLVSGIYDPRPVLQISVNDEIGLTPAMAARCDATAQPPRSGLPLLVAVGGDEPAGWIAQSTDYHRGAGPDAEFMTCPGKHHFTVGECLCDPKSPVFQWLLAAIRAI